MNFPSGFGKFPAGSDMNINLALNSMNGTCQELQSDMCELFRDTLDVSANNYQAVAVAAVLVGMCGIFLGLHEIKKVLQRSEAIAPGAIGG